MTERRLPDPICGSICKLSMSERCIEECAPQGEMEMLEVREDLTIDRMPAYEVREDLKWKARFRLQEAYTKKAVDFIQGKQEVPYDSVPVFPRRRPSSDLQIHSGRSPSKPSESVPAHERNGTPEIRQKYPSNEIGVPEMERKSEEKTV